jgi:ferredoxin
MPALAEEIREALEEGITILNGWAPQKLHRKNGKPLAVEFCRTEVERDEASGAVKIIPVGIETQKHFADRIIVAIGQTPKPFPLSEEISIKEDGMATDRFGRTSLPKIFVGGDIKGGRAFVADAIASGKMGAFAISCFLEGKDVEAEFRYLQFGDRPSFSLKHFIGPDERNWADFKKVVSFDQINTLFFYQSDRNNPDRLEAMERIRTFEEVNGGLTSERVEDEISRCFGCGTCIDCENCLDFCPDLSILKDTELRRYGFDEDHCKGCGICSVACPRNVVEMVSEKNENVFDR